MFSIGVKIQILLFMLVVLVGLYLFVLQKEMRLMQHDLGMLKSTVTEMCKNEVPTVTEQHHCVREGVDEDDDEESVSSKEIKEMLTNITVPEGEVEVEVDAQEEEEEEDSNYALYEESELEKVKCEDLRNFLKKQGVDSKGKKPDLVKKVLELSL